MQRADNILYDEGISTGGTTGMTRSSLLSIMVFVLWGCGDNTAPFTPDRGAAMDVAPTAQDAGPGERGPDQTAPDTGNNGWDGWPQKPVLGIYTVTGSDPTWGSYTGQAEVRLNAFDQYMIYHTARYDSATFEGDKIALAWEGEIHSKFPPFPVTFYLRRVGFIDEYQSTSRAGAETAPLLFKGDLQVTGPGVLSGTLTPQSGAGGGFTETWTWVSPGGAEPIWQDQRQTARGPRAPLRGSAQPDLHLLRLLPRAGERAALRGSTGVPGGHALLHLRPHGLRVLSGPGEPGRAAGDPAGDGSHQPGGDPSPQPRLPPDPGGEGGLL